MKRKFSKNRRSLKAVLSVFMAFAMSAGLALQRLAIRMTTAIIKPISAVMLTNPWKQINRRIRIRP